MNSALIENWNNLVKDDDDIYILGDFAFKGASFVVELLEKLKGKKYLVKGNHDKFVMQEEFDQSQFVWIKDYFELKYEDKYFILFHFPILEWNGMYRNSYHLHGHQHNYYDYNILQKRTNRKLYDVGVDANNYAPVSIEYILKFFEN